MNVDSLFGGGGLYEWHKHVDHPKNAPYCERPKENSQSNDCKPKGELANELYQRKNR